MRPPERAARASKSTQSPPRSSLRSEAPTVLLCSASPGQLACHCHSGHPRRSHPHGLIPTLEKIVPVLASKKEHTRLSKSAPATATRLTLPRHKCSPNRVQAHTLRLFSPKHSITPLPPCQSELDSPRLPPASAARLLWTSSAAPRGREGVCPGREVVRPRTANPV